MDLPAEPGSDEFENVIFILENPVTKHNLEQLAFHDDVLPEAMNEEAWAMPAYLSEGFNLFFIFAQNMGSNWTVTFAQVTIENGNEITSMTNVVPTGTGFNAVAHVDRHASIELLAYFETLAGNGVGHWEMGH
ncbi:hypothetical protein [Loigolactobacillus backii]|uniref:Uncharacterized protein n=1 Tax=Loigolactobacillus backii TaxID=375175 RepID=A0A192H175_9LACO|nr:hypothetical protein [Loigolactobacillus backii]ANK62105.1 hypothetical protein AYR53_04570 [Loigolactobacillus backii]ANK68700.1 hypothetical protein AYR56_00150 [Loigolactobacillus backii]MDA5386704.1 hypothetical protein [Loigolactobacillus backii]MDA5389229.1 hypothetical protein [Loigolactobacillus backii]